MATDSQRRSELQRASADLMQSRDQFVATMGALEHELTRTLDWRAWVSSRPRMALSIAFTIGLLLGRKR